MKQVRWFLAEFLVVVTGVLVAFALNSWWIDTKESKKEEVYLEQIKQDIRGSIALLETSLSFEDNATKASASLLKAAYSKQIPPDSLLAQYAFQAMSYEPGKIIQTTLVSILYSGDLQLISNDSIRLELRNLSGEILEYQELRTHASNNMLMPAFKEFSQMVSPLELSIAYLKEPNYTQALQDSTLPLPVRDNLQEIPKIDWRQLMETDSFRDRLTFLWIAHINLRRAHANGLEKLKSSLDKIERLSKT
jgi:hypothetical protein